MSAPADTKETVILQTSDDEQFTVDKKVAARSAMIKVMLDGESRLPVHARIIHSVTSSEL